MVNKNRLKTRKHIYFELKKKCSIFKKSFKDNNRYHLDTKVEKKAWTSIFESLTNNFIFLNIGLASILHECLSAQNF